MYTRIPDFRHPSATSAVFTRFLNSISHDMDNLVRSPNQPSINSRALRGKILLPNPQLHNKWPDWKTFLHMGQFQLSHDFAGKVRHGLTFKEIPRFSLVRTIDWMTSPRGTSWEA